MGVGGQRHAPAVLPPGMTQYPLYGRPEGRFGRVPKILPPPGFDPRTVQLVVSRCTDSYPVPLQQGKTESKKWNVSFLRWKYCGSLAVAKQYAKLWCLVLCYLGTNILEEFAAPMFMVGCEMLVHLCVLNPKMSCHMRLI